MSPKVSTKSHPLRMSTRSHPFWKIVSTRCYCPRNVSIPNESQLREVLMNLRLQMTSQMFCFRTQSHEKLMRNFIWRLNWVERFRQLHSTDWAGLIILFRFKSGNISPFNEGLPHILATLHSFLQGTEQCSASKATTMSSKNATQRETGCSETEACTLIPLKKEVLDDQKLREYWFNC